MNKQELFDMLKKYGQEHLVQFYDELSESEREILIDEIKNVNLAEITKFYVKSKLEEEKAATELDSMMEPIPEGSKGVYDKCSTDELNMYEDIGLEAISKGEVAVLLLAGGQGTRLGVTYPKGMYSVDLPSSKTLFQLQSERLKRVQDLAAKKFSKKTVSLPWYIMGSEHTLDTTKEFFKKHNFFNLNENDVTFFEQYTLPCLTNDGKIILDKKYKISRSPDGNGGLYKALLKRNILDDMAKRGIKYLHVYGVDNILVRIADPVFMGFCIQRNGNCACKVVKKTNPDESVGVICKVNKRFQVVEYSEISDATRKLRDSNGDLVYNAANICNHFFTTEFLNEVCRKHEHELKHHIAYKKIPFVDVDGVYKKPSKNNGIKLEKFIFDVFPLSSEKWTKGNFLTWEVNREEEFSALKNGNDAQSDNPNTCRQNLTNQHLKWLVSAGAIVDTDVQVCEVSPLVSYSGENLESVVKGKRVKNGLVIDYDMKTNKFLFDGMDYNEYEQKILLSK